MEVGAWLAWILVFAIILFVVVGIIYVVFKPTVSQPDIPSFLAKYESPDTWGQATPGPSAPRNSCLQYTFEATMVGSTAFPGQPTLNPTILNGLTGSVPGPCIDVDQIVAQQLTHTCQGPTGAASFCYRSNGTLATPGETELFFDTGNCQVPPCSGTLAVVALDFNPPISIVCMQEGGTGQQLTVATCDLANEDQLFRFTRIAPGGTIPPPPGVNSGPLAQILDRQTGFCVMPASGLTGPTGPAPGTPVILAPCSVNQGFVWFIAPALAGSVGGSAIVGLQQLAYIGNLQTFPTITDFADYFNFTINNNIQTLGISGSDVVMEPYAWSINVSPTDFSQSSQYLDYTLYNILNNEGATVPVPPPFRRN